MGDTQMCRMNDPGMGTRSDTMSLVTARMPQVMLRVGAISVTLLPELNKAARYRCKTRKLTAIRDNFLYYRVKTRYKHNGGYVISPGPAVPRGEHFDENTTGER